MKIAVIGACGWAGQRHLAAFRSLGVQVTHLVDPDPRCAAIAAAIGARALGDHRDLRNADLDAVSVALPPADQPDVCKAFLQRGVSVLCEKPVAATAVQAAEIRDLAAERSGAVFMPGFLLRFHPVFLRMRAIVLSGELGPIHELKIDGRVKRTEITGWRCDPNMGGVALVNAIHAFDLARWLVGELGPPVFSTIGNRHFPIATEDWMDAILYSKSGARVQIRSAWWPFREDDIDTLDLDGWVVRLRIEAERGTLILTRDGYMHVHSGGTAAIAMHSTIDLFQAEIAQFLDCVKNKKVTPITADDNLAAQRLVEQTKSRADLFRAAANSAAVTFGSQNAIALKS